MPPPTFTEIFWSFLYPWLFLFESVKRFPPTVLRLLRAGDARTLLSWSRLRAAWFGTFWEWAGPAVRSGAEANVVPILQGRVRAGRIVDEVEAVHAGVGGTVLEIGPGSGMWVSLFSERYLGSGDGKATGAGTASGSDAPPPKAVNGLGRSRQGESRTPVTHVFGVEPNAEVHHLLQQQVRSAGLDSVYEIVPVGIEDLASSGCVPKGSVDCIVSILCLCSIPDPERNIRELYSYLKPGGRWYVYEHVKHEGYWGMVLYQGVIHVPSSLSF